MFHLFDKGFSSKSTFQFLEVFFWQCTSSMMPNSFGFVANLIRKLSFATVIFQSYKYSHHHWHVNLYGSCYLINPSTTPPFGSNYCNFYIFLEHLTTALLFITPFRTDQLKVCLLSPESNWRGCGGPSGVLNSDISLDWIVPYGVYWIQFWNS